MVDQETLPQVADSPLLIGFSYEKRRAEFEDFKKSLHDRVSSFQLTPIEARVEIAEYWHHRYLRLPIFNLAIRPFWRDGKKAPPLKETPPRKYYYSHHY